MVPRESQPWPPAVELEKWLMKTVKDADAGCLFLRRLLHMNPAYGQYLASDQDLAGIVQVFAKRLRAIILASENPIQPTTLYEPLCEVTWRVAGHTLHTIIDLQNVHSLPVPREASGHLKMLLQTNVELSRKLSDLRRAYLRELSMHRDKQRRLSEKAERALKDLKEEPVMFYEPLAYVLDEQTKAFVREVVEERIKLEHQPGHAMETAETDDLRIDLAELESKLKTVEGENRMLRSTAAREAEAAKRANELEAQWREEAVQERRFAQSRLEEHAELELQVPPLRTEINQLRRQLLLHAEQAKKDQPEEQTLVVLEDPQVGILRSQLDKANAEVKTLQVQIEQLYEELRSQEQVLEAASEKMLTLERSKEPVKEVETVPVIQEQEECINFEEELKAQSERHMKIEKELRAANRALEKALEEAKAKGVRTPKQPNNRPAPPSVCVAATETTIRMDTMVEKSKKNIDDEIARAVQIVVAESEKKIKDQERDIEQLKKALEAALAAAKHEAPAGVDEGIPVPIAKVKSLKRASAVPVLQTVAGEDKMNSKIFELEDKIEEMESENDNLRQQVSVLLEKLKAIGGKEAVQEVMEEIKLNVLPNRRKRKLKAYERLWQDAKRRIIAMRMRQQNLRELEQRELVEVAKKVKDRRNLRQVEMLGHLQKAAEATRDRFHDALANFHDHNGTPRQMDVCRDRADTNEVDSEVDEANCSDSPRTLNDQPFQERRWACNSDMTVRTHRLEQLEEENRMLQAEVGRLRLLQGTESFGPSNKSIVSRSGPGARPPSASSLVSSGPSTLIRNQSSPPGMATSTSSSPPPSQGQPRPSFGIRHGSRSQVPSTSSSPTQAAAAKGGAVATPSTAGVAAQSLSQSPGYPGSVGSPEGAPSHSFSATLSTHGAAPWAHKMSLANLSGARPLSSGAWRSSIPGEAASAAATGPTAALPASSPPGWAASVNALPQGQAVKGHGPDWVPTVPGRVPAASPLGPIQKSAGSTSPRTRSSLGPRAGDEHLQHASVGLPAPLLSAWDAAPEAAAGAVPDPTAMRSMAKTSKSHKGSSTGFMDEVKPPMGNFCVTALRSQESLASLSGGNPKCIPHCRWSSP